MITLRIVNELGIDRSTLFVSEWPGTVGFYTHNEIIAGDMLTSNRRLVDRMKASPNAIPVLFDEAQRHGAPVRYLLYNGGIFFRPSADFHELDYMDPRMIDNAHGHVIGHIRLGPLLINRDGIVVWKVDEAQ